MRRPKDAAPTGIRSLSTADERRTLMIRGDEGFGVLDAERAIWCRTWIIGRFRSPTLYKRAIKRQRKAQ